MATTPKKASKSVTPKQPWIEVFRAGDHVDVKGVSRHYEDADMDAFAEKWNGQVASGFVPPMVTGHPKSDSPRQAGVFEARASGSSPRRLYVRVDEVVPEFAEAVQRGEYKYVSIALYPDGGLRHLGALGGHNPAVKGMEPLEFGEGMFAESDTGKNAADILEFAEEFRPLDMIGSALMRIAWRIQSVGSLIGALRDQMIADKGSVEEADTVYPPYLVESLTGFDLSDVAAALSSGDSGSSFSEPAGGSPSSLPPASGGSVPAAGAGEDTSELEGLRQKLRERELSDSFAAFGERLNALQAEGRILAAERPSLEALFKRLSESVEGAMYSEGDPAWAEIDAMLASRPKLIEFGEYTPPKPPSIKSPLIADAERRSKV